MPISIVEPLPSTLAENLEIVGETCWGSAWKVNLARGIAIGRTTLFRYMPGDGAQRTQEEIDQDLLEFLAAERQVNADRAHAIGALPSAARGETQVRVGDGLVKTILPERLTLIGETLLGTTGGGISRAASASPASLCSATGSAAAAKRKLNMECV